MIGLAEMANLAVAQQANISLNSGTAIPGGSISIDLTLTGIGGSQPAALEWTMNYPASDIESVDVTAGANAAAAGKSVTCAVTRGTTKCVVYGANKNVLSLGIAATATFHIASGAPDSQVPIQIVKVAAADANGALIHFSATNGAIMIAQPPSPTKAMLPTIWYLTGFRSNQHNSASSSTVFPRSYR